MEALLKSNGIWVGREEYEKIRKVGVRFKLIIHPDVVLLLPKKRTLPRIAQRLSIRDQERIIDEECCR